MNHLTLVAKCLRVYRVMNCVLLTITLAASASRSMAATEPGPKTFDVAAGDASDTLKRAAQQAGLEIMFPTSTVRGVTTNPVKGEFTPQQALAKMLQGTSLTVVHDESTGALSVTQKPAPARRPADKPEPSAPKPAAKADEPAKSSARASEVVQMTPYQVEADSDKSYGALNSNSITAFNTELLRMPISADIMDQAFMDDVGATSIEGLLTTFSAGAGIGGIDPGNASQANQPGDRLVQAFIQLRGFSTPAMQRDGLMAVGAFGSPGSTAPDFSSNFDVERVEVINGPQALLFGASGGAGGVINVISKQARLGQKPFGSLSYRVDGFGSKTGQFDYGLGTDKVAVRVAFMKQTQNNRRVNVGGWINGQFVQIAVRPFSNTIIRLTGEQTKFDRLVAGMVALGNIPTTDPRRGMMMKDVLALFLVGPNNPATGQPYPAGAAINGILNQGNVDSWQGGAARELTVNSLASLTVESKWTPWLSTQFAGGYDQFDDDRINVAFNLYSPGVAGNPLPGWTGGVQPNLSRLPNRAKVFRASALLTNDFFHNKVHSQTNIGWDYSQNVTSNLKYFYYLADSNWKTVVNPAVAVDNGRTQVPVLFWSLDKGPVLYTPFPKPGDKRLVANGNNYNMELANPPRPELVSPSNPLGVPFTNNRYQIATFTNSGFYVANDTQVFNKKLDILSGFRLARFTNNELREVAPTTIHTSNNNAYGYNLGAIYAINNWLHPYLTFSNSYTPPITGSLLDPYNTPPKTTHGIGQEVGLKSANASGTFSSTIAVYHANAHDDNYPMGSSVVAYINPAGLNGGGGGSYIKVDRSSRGVQLTVTAAPSDNWRMRLSAAWVDGTIKTDVSYKALYNDQFYTNAQGQVTYRDGTVVTVNPNSFTASAPVSSAAGSVPLTINMLSTPGNPYYTNVGVDGLIGGTSNGGLTLKVVDPLHGPILTGATLLPISNYQLNTALTGITPLPVVVASRAGEQTTGYPTFSTNYTTSYTFTEGWLKNFRLGGTITASWRYRDFYYYPKTASYIPPGGGSPERIAFYLPTAVQFGLITGYSHRFGRYNFRSQFNITNLFNQYKVIILPSAQNAYTSLTSINATFNTQPRAWFWTNSVDF